MTNTPDSTSVIDYRLAYRLTRRHDIAFLKGLAKHLDMEQVLISEDAQKWLNNTKSHANDIISKLHVLLDSSTVTRPWPSRLCISTRLPGTGAFTGSASPARTPAKFNACCTCSCSMRSMSPALSACRSFVI